MIYLPVSRTILRSFNLDQLRVIEWSIPVRALCPSNQRYTSKREGTQELFDVQLFRD